MNPNPDHLNSKYRTTFREWLTLLPWDIIYGLGAFILVVLVALLASPLR